MRGDVLTRDEQALLAEERDALSRLHGILAAIPGSPSDQEALAQSVRRLDELFLLVVVGEFNSGKSTFINALVGQRVLEEGATPTTRHIQVLTYGPEVSHAGSEGAIDLVTAPVDMLRQIHIVDTPGTNAIFREHEAITVDYVPRADVVLFITSADRPFTETERGFMAAIREWGKKIVVVINKADILETPADREGVEQFVRSSAAALLGREPEIFAVSARAALRAKIAGGNAAALDPAAQSFAALEHYLATTLDARERVRLKLLNPIGVARRLSERYLALVDADLHVLADDVRATADIEGQLTVYREDMSREFRHRLSSVDNVLHAFEQRGVAFFDDTLRIGRVFDLLNKSRLKAEFERDVIQDLPQLIERHVHDIIDWMVASDLRQWQAVMERIRARRATHAGRLAGDIDSRFEYDRAQLLETVGRTAERTVERYDLARESEAMAESVRMAVAGAALAEVGAIGLGAAVTALATTTFADVTGVMAAGALAVIGLFVIPVRRAQAKAAMRVKIESMRQQLIGTLTTQFEDEVSGSVARVRDAIAPYTRFVTAEQQRLGAARAALSQAGEELGGLQRRVETLPA
ncbi:MAG TPA: dynamin family protein, partial [Vicinamibacterales bacterium]|nr:dynamin family protein [Vicinamibacterales bacterium]